MARLLPPCDRCETGCGSDFSSPAVYGQEAYPAAMQTWQLGPGVTIPVQCAAYAAEAFVQNDASRTLFPCNLPWVATEPTNTEAYCALACPARIVPLATYEGVALMSGILGWISYLLTAAVIATMCFIPRYRRFPSCMILIAVLGAHITAFAFVFLITRGWRRTLCESNYKPSLGRSAHACVFEVRSLISTYA